MFKYRQYEHDEYVSKIFSFGSGVQSSALMLMIIFEPERIKEYLGSLPDWIIFADTGAEKFASIKNLEKFNKLVKKNQFYTGLNKIIRIKNWTRNAETHPHYAPLFFPGNKSIQRQCTSDWKIRPLHKACRKLTKKKKPFAIWLGISTDEVQRMKLSRFKDCENVYPLIEMNMNRDDCYSILKKYGWEVEKSSCYMCPYQKDWNYEGEEKKLIIEIEKKIQDNSKFKNIPYLHPSAIPIKQIIERQQAQTNLFTFNDECDGVCGS